MAVWGVIVVLLFVSLDGMLSQLIVNVKNQGGDVLRETIDANTTLDTITLDFQQADGTLVTQFIDFKNEIQIFKATVLGEEELGQIQHQVMCFVTRFIKNEFISSDAMSKLRQKNPSAIRHPEEEKPREEIEMDLLVSVDQAGIISHQIAHLCEDAGSSVFARDSDLKVLSKTLNKDYTMLVSATKTVPLYRTQNCRDIPLKDQWRPCLCECEMCIGWYPCGLKYCKGKDSAGKVVSYRCGIKTCRKCRLFQFYSRQKQQCLSQKVMDQFPDLNAGAVKDTLAQKEDNNVVQFEQLPDDM